VFATAQVRAGDWDPVLLVELSQAAGSGRWLDPVLVVRPAEDSETGHPLPSPTLHDILWDDSDRSMPAASSTASVVLRGRRCVCVCRETGAGRMLDG
jgi:hypothetical protein